MKEVIVSWSGGKDSAYALSQLLESKDYKVKGLLSTTSEDTGRLPVHEVNRDLLRAQAESLDLALFEVQLPAEADNITYEQALSGQFNKFKSVGIDTIAYADLYLEDIKHFRDSLLQRLGMNAIYPLWKKDTMAAAVGFLEAGFQAVVTTIDSQKLPDKLTGEIFSKDFVQSLPGNVDPCGENGEFHTFVFDGPIFNHKIEFETGNHFKTMNGRFIHCELK
ncbi:diphthine--ammonia ligase [Halobacillus sp. Marseille-P3879]|uniref:Dph6-related ATP pyrophosphatase n=1 Tax=Halobacillus sp. Marseille-P3879 TaxID=2045014 RepID=UPI001359BAD2|nr:diphthine--ammonia ligase [Halobacillus sp. Marseille-P3879]